MMRVKSRFDLSLRDWHQVAFPFAWNIGGTLSKHSGDFPVIAVTEFTGIALLFLYFPLWGGPVEHW